MDAVLTSSRPTPPFMAVFSEQLGLIGRSLWREAAIFGVAVLLVTVLAVWQILDHHMTVDFPIDGGPLFLGFGVCFGGLVWKDEKPFDTGHMQALPVAHDQHLLIRTLAGGVWLGGIVAWGLIWLAGMGLLSGGDLGFDRYLLLNPPPLGEEVAPGALRLVRWTPETWHWLSVVSAVAVGYLIACAFCTGLRHKIRWSIVAIALGMVVALDPFGIGGALAEPLIRGPAGLDNLILDGTDGVNYPAIMANGEPVTAWLRMPDPRPWAIATATWLAIGMGLVGLAAWRHRER